jgi:hypothetical protein
MNPLTAASVVVIVASCISLCQGALLHHRDTLHIMSAFGREVSFSVQNQFNVDSINLGTSEYPCSLSHAGIFFVSLGYFPTCPCCPTWSIASARSFYSPKKANVNWAASLDLNDSAKFFKFDTTRLYEGAPCHLPKVGGPDYKPFVFINTAGFTKTTYLLVNVMGSYIDQKKPTQTGGGDLGYPVRTCTNMLIVDMWLQTDGSANFAGASITSIGGAQAPSGIVSLPLARPSHLQLYDLRGRSLSSTVNGRPFAAPQGCYLVKDGQILRKRAMIAP